MSVGASELLETTPTICHTETFVDTAPNYPRFPQVTKTLSGQDIDRHALRDGAIAEESLESRELTEEELTLTSPIVYGFSLSDKYWCEYATSRGDVH